MKCPHCQKEITKKLPVCPICKEWRFLETMTAEGSAKKCHKCNRSFLLWGDGWYNSYKKDPKQIYWDHDRIAEVEYIDVPYEKEVVY